MLSELRILPLALAALQIATAFAENGYHYNRPTGLPPFPLAQRIPKYSDGRYYAPLPTVLPKLPALPTARPSHVSSQSLVQVHPPPRSTTITSSKSIANAYRTPGTSYTPPTGASIFRSGSNQPQLQLPLQPQPQSIFGQRIQSPTPQVEAAPQPLRIPFGKQAVVRLPTGPTGPADQLSYELGGRKLNQYAVIEIIDNDIEQNMQPFLTTPFIDNYRARIGASGTGAAPPPLGQQIESRSSALVMEQQRLAQPQSGSNDAVALGSGGLGFVRLANGNVYLGSGSLGYISGQQHSAFIQDARTRTGAPMPDPLHFGHGPLGTPGNAGTFRF